MTDAGPARPAPRAGGRRETADLRGGGVGGTPYAVGDVGRLAVAGATALATVLVVAGVAVVRDRLDDDQPRTPEPADLPVGHPTRPAPPGRGRVVPGRAGLVEPRPRRGAGAAVRRPPAVLPPPGPEPDRCRLVEDPTLDRAIAVFGRGDVVVLVDPEGQTRRVTIDLPRARGRRRRRPDRAVRPGACCRPTAAPSRSGRERAGRSWTSGPTRWSTVPGDGEVATGPRGAGACRRPCRTRSARWRSTGRWARRAELGDGARLPVRDPSAYLGGPATSSSSGPSRGRRVLAFMTASTTCRVAGRAARSRAGSTTTPSSTSRSPRAATAGRLAGRHPRLPAGRLVAPGRRRRASSPLSDPRRPDRISCTLRGRVLNMRLALSS